ncbi:MAG TPA: penicillin-binding transpeptidase domain-containing protein [Dehalococcoidia bacterium]|nr:penicillin-binding transpeptidase domain-containing protein [Dehalococcoidia bacterium]
MVFRNVIPQRTLLVPLLLALAVLAAACDGSDNGDNGPTERPRTPDDAATRWLELWGQDQFEAMYELVATESRAAVDEETFVSRYEAIKETATITGFDFLLTGTGSPAETEILGGEDLPEGVIEVPFKVTFKTEFFGDVPEENALPLVRETVTLPATEEGGEPVQRDEWRVVWTPSLYFSQLDDESLVNFFPRSPRRGTIYDRNGEPLALDADLPVIGFVVDYLTDREAAIAALAAGLGASDGEIRPIFDLADTQPSYYFTPVRALPYTTTDEDVQKFRDMVDLGIIVREDTQRFYPHEDSAAHVIGYMSEVTEDDLQDPTYEGYQPGDLIGSAGLESQYQDTLAGTRGGLLAAVSPEGVITATIAEAPSTPGKDVWLTIDLNVQKQAEAQLGDKVGAVVVMDPRDNSVVAMASYPRFNPNSFIRGLTDEEATNLFNNPNLPFLNRALLAEYPPGSTFKVVTMAGGVETTDYTTGSTFHCVPVWTGLGEDFPQKNWQTVDRGFLTPAEGLMASCNPVFFDLAKRMDEIDEQIFPDFIRQFGYGEPTGIGMEEAAGVVPDPAWKEENVGEAWFRGDAVNMGIGQGYVLATPIQITNAYSAIASSGVLKKPLLIWRVGEPSAGGGVAVQEYQAEEIRPLPVSQETLDSIRHGLYLVTQSTGGTSYQAWVGTPLDVAGKSGTAEDLAEGSDHVFFAAYANRSAPSLVALGVLEEGESGSSQVAPMLRNILETHVGLPPLSGVVE